MAETRFREVTKEQFREVYFRLGNGARSGWTADYWSKLFEGPADRGWRFLVEAPADALHDQMWIVADSAAREYRLFFRIDD